MVCSRINAIPARSCRYCIQRLERCAALLLLDPGYVAPDVIKLRLVNGAYRVRTLFQMLWSKGIDLDLIVLHSE